ncbi:extracellular solute-binding protein [Paenibacillus chungangensis]|uniref:Extracellular solute-binding protein n=1 Tax=Paenibacillus chungangensis TaxID=696535 RepID=A0ABW3HU50_9BACL
MIHGYRISLLLIVAMLLGIVTACAGSNGTEQTNEPSNTTGNKGEAVKENVTSESKEPQHIKIVVNNGSRKFPEGMDANSNPYLDYIESNTNLDIEVVTPPKEGYQEKVNVMMASGDLPDMIYSNDSAWLANMVKQKALKPLNEAIDKAGSHLKAFIPEEAWKSVTFGGNIYAIPVINPVPGNEIMYIRKDWLDNVGMESPTTLEEYVDVMRAFAQNDPDQNGKDDTMGLIVGENLGLTAPITGAFGVQKGQWVERDGKLVYSSTLPEMKQAIQFLAELYKEGLIDQEWALNKYATVTEKISSGKTGLFSAMWYDTRGPIKTSQQNDPDAEWVSAEFPIGPDGKQGTFGSSLIKGYNVVPTTSKHADGVVKMLDYLIDEGHRDMVLGFEGEVWTEKEGKVETNFEEHNKHIYRLTLAELVGIPDDPVAFEKNDALGLEFKLSENIRKINQHKMHSLYLGAPTPGMAKYGDKLKTLEETVFATIVMGKKPIDAFDQFVKEWNEQGGSEITDEVNAWYKSQ